MAQAAKVIDGETWVQLTTAGEEGQCWLKERNDSNWKGSGQIYIYHSSAPPTGDSELELSKRLYKPSGNTDVFDIAVDDSNDIFYARGVTSDDGATIIVDVI